MKEWKITEWDIFIFSEKVEEVVGQFIFYFFSKKYITKKEQCSSCSSAQRVP